jgi:Kef-type K+ transport system membrane component KefB
VASLFVIALISAAVPIVVGLFRLKIAEVVLLLGLGVLFGPQVLGLITINSTTNTFNELGLGMLFFLAGYELEMARGARPLRQARGQRLADLARPRVRVSPGSSGRRRASSRTSPASPSP